MSIITSVKRNSFNTKNMVLIALMSVFIAICSWISVPLEVPFTLQTFAVFCTLMLLGGKNGLFSVMIYILLGAVGIPVFSGFTGGIGIILGTTGGYIVGFIFMALIFWAFEKIPVESKYGRMVFDIAAMILGTAVLYAFGTAWFIYVYTANTGEVSIWSALKWCVIPFIPVDMIKIAAAALVTKRIKKHVR